MTHLLGFVRVSALLCALLAVLGAAGCGDRTDILPDFVDGSVPPDARVDSRPDAHPDAHRHDAGSCGPATCSEGCCDSMGACQIGSSNVACGLRGASCVSCAAEGLGACDPTSGACTSQASCGPNTCAGCCDATGACELGALDTACGVGGATCRACGPGATCSGQTCAGALCCLGNSCAVCAADQPCVDGMCVSPPPMQCSPESCAGCCGTDGTCRSGTHPHHCGTAGETCADCGSGTCSDGACTVTSCGGPGQACCGGSCTDGSACDNGVCPGCSPQNCPGCCDASGTCQIGSSLNACGTGGRTCGGCTIDQACVNGSCQGSTCFTGCGGCCDAQGICQNGTTTSACGPLGGLCATCSVDAQCFEGQCSGSTCDATTCPTGCCDLSGACQPGNFSSGCGTAGAACAGCDSTSQCISGVCVETGCGEHTCGGCCDAMGTCQNGDTNAACGENGDPCAVCPADGSCSDQVCTGFVCGPASCPNGCCDSSGVCQTTFGGSGNVCTCQETCQGCCDAQDNCHAGTIDGACGSSGATCADCTTQGLTCDLDAFPVICDQSCPSPYDGCPAGLTMEPPNPFPNACLATDLADAASACAAGAETAQCNAFFEGEEDANTDCAFCLQQFDIDFVDLTGIYTCAQPFLNPACNTKVGCANDCASTVCEECALDQTTCETTAIAGECAMLVSAGNSCVAASSQANALCSSSNYPNFGAWLATVGKHYCQL